MWITNGKDEERCWELLERRRLVKRKWRTTCPLLGSSVPSTHFTLSRLRYPFKTDLERRKAKHWTRLSCCLLKIGPDSNSRFSKTTRSNIEQDFRLRGSPFERRIRFYPPTLQTAGSSSKQRYQFCLFWPFGFSHGRERQVTKNKWTFYLPTGGRRFPRQKMMDDIESYHIASASDCG